MNPIRKAIQKTGFDFHRHYAMPDKMEYLKNLGIRTVFDVGANVGQFAVEIRKILPEAQIYSFEPIRESFDGLQKNMTGDKNFKAFNFALGEKDGEITMQKNEYLPSSSILPLSENHIKLFPHTTKTSPEKITVKRLDDVVSNLNIKKEILVKMDVQGFEDKVILGGQNIFRDAKAVIVETSFVELYRGQPLFDDIYKQLKNLGFSYRGGLQEKLNKTGEIISEDSFFTKD